MGKHAMVVGIVWAILCEGLTRHGSHASRHVMAVLPAGSVPGIGEQLTVTEDLEHPNSPTLFESTSGLKFELTKSAEPQTPDNVSALWVNGSDAAVIAEGADLMGNALLHRGNGTEPSYAEIAPLAPPLLASPLRCGDYSLTGQTFVGSRIAAEKRSFTPLGEMNNMDIRQRKHLDQTKLQLNATFVGLLGDFTPAVRWYWPLTGDGWVEQTAFAVPESTDEQPFDVSSPQPIWIRYLNVSQDGQVRHVQYVNTFEQYPYYCRNASVDPAALLPSPECDGQNAAAYYTALFAFARYWNETFISEGSMELDLPSDDIDTAAFAKHSVARIMITRRDMYHPRYGAPPLYYASCCDGFQDVFAADMAVFLEWGLLPSAAGVLDNFFTFYMRRHAVVNYRGPEIAQYGRTLTLIAQYYRLSGGDPTELLLKHALKITDISDMLLSRRREAQRRPKTDPSFGMIRGEDESDEMFSGWSEATSELPHFSFSLEAWRGFTELGPVWQELGAHCDSTKYPGCARLTAVGNTLVQEAPLLLTDIQRAMVASVNGTGFGNVCHPYVAGEGLCSDMVVAHVSNTSGPYNGRAQEPWRSYSGMLYAGALDSKTVQEIVDYNQNHDKLSHLGIWSGVGGFRNQFMSFTEQGHGYGLVQHGLVEHFLLQLFSEMAHDCTRGSWTCFESRGIPDWTPAGGYTEASQSIVPLHVKWMLVFEPPPTITGVRSLQLCKATPRAWLSHGRRISVKRAPTVGHGRVSISIVSNLDATTPHVHARVSRNASEIANMNNTGVGMVTLTLRVPTQWKMMSVTVNGHTWTSFDAMAETVDLTSALAAASNGVFVDVHVAYEDKQQAVMHKTDDNLAQSLPPPAPAPEMFTVTFTTDVEPEGEIPVVVTRSWAPLGADRFYAAVQDGFYNDSAFFRVVPANSSGCHLTCGGIVQFGISGNKTMNFKWLHSPIKDDPVTHSNTVGRINFADAGRNTRSTELVFMLGDNSNQDAAGFAPFGEIQTTQGLATARKIFNPTPGNTMGIDQSKYERNGNVWVKRMYPGTNFVIGAAVTSVSSKPI